MSAKKTTSTDSWIKLMQVGARTGCHQRADRSFFYNGYQFPICARCTGVLIGYIAALICAPFYMSNYIVGLVFCAVMFIDWFIQFLKIIESTNIRRLITGVLGGYGIITCELNIVLFLILYFSD